MEDDITTTTTLGVSEIRAEQWYQPLKGAPHLPRLQNGVAVTMPGTLRYRPGAAERTLLRMRCGLWPPLEGLTAITGAPGKQACEACWRDALADDHASVRPAGAAGYLATTSTTAG